MSSKNCCVQFRRVIAHVHEIIAASGLKAANIRVLLTGHSLGGALAGLAAHDLVTQCGLTNCQVSASTLHIQMIQKEYTFHQSTPRWVSSGLMRLDASLHV